MSESSPHTQARPSGTPAVAEEAARWSERLREAGADPELRAEFEAWRGDDPERAQAFERAEAAWTAARSAATDPRILELRNQVLARAAENSEPRTAWARWAAAAAAVTICVLAGFGLAHLASPSPDDAPVIELAMAEDPGLPDYVTQVGERLSAALPDGTALTLNTASQARLDFTAEERRVYLLQGQAFFDVAHDAARPFVVIAGERRVTALGTAFEVRLDADDLSVTLVEGRVTVEPVEPLVPDRSDAGELASASVRAQLQPGERFTQTAEAEPEVTAVDARRLTSWLDGVIIFEDDTLGEAVAEMNRYAQRPILIADEELAALRLSGAFGAGRSSEFVEALSEYFPEVRVQSTEQAILLTARG